MSAFALLVQPDFCGAVNSLKATIFSQAPVFIGGKLEGLKTTSGSGEAGWLICQPRLSKTNYSDETSARIYRRRAQQLIKLTQRLGINILGIDEADYGGWGEFLKSHSSFTLSEGIAYRAGLVRQLLVESLNRQGTPLSQVRVVVTGAGSPLGRICARVLATRVRKLSLAGVSEREFDALARQILYESGTSVRLVRELNQEFSENDVLVAADEEPEGGRAGIWRELKAGALILLVSSQSANRFRSFSLQADIHQLMVSLPPQQIRFKSSLLYKAYQGLLRENWPDWLNHLHQLEPMSSGRQLVPASLAEIILLAGDQSLPASSPENNPDLRLVDKLSQTGKQLDFIPQFCKVLDTGSG